MSKAEWTKHGLATLTANGIGAIKTGAMAKALGVSRGSFYWHFADISEFRVALLEHWADITTDRVIEQTDAKAGMDSLRDLLQRAYLGDRALDRAVRAWATQDPDAERIVAGVDRRRVAHIADLLVAAGQDKVRANDRACFLYWAYLGQPLTLEADQQAISEQALDEIAQILSR